jgi:Zn-dependent M28 family amino/carboxypeptidase
MRKFFLLIFLFLLGFFTYQFFLAVNKQKSAELGDFQVKQQDIDTNLGLFAQERHTKEGKEAARRVIIREFESYGYRVSKQEAGSNVNIIADKGQLGIGYILVGAHYDTVEGSPGADDNASGMAALLALAKYNKSENVRFIAFDGEEDNLIGSTYYAKNIALAPAFVIIFEMIGYTSIAPNSQQVPPYYEIAYRPLYNRLKQRKFRGDFSALICTPGAKDICKRFEGYATTLGFEAYTIAIPRFLSNFPMIKDYFKDLYRSDHAPFAKAGIPSISITDTANFRNPNYHQFTDTLDTLDKEFIRKQADAVLALLNFFETQKR